MRRAVAWVGALVVLVLLLPTLCMGSEDGATRCSSLLLPLPWGESSDTWGYAVAIGASLTTFVALRLLLGPRRRPTDPE